MSLNRKLLVAAFIAVSGCSTAPLEPNVKLPEDPIPAIKISRYFAITACLKNEAKCREPLNLDTENANIGMALLTYKKGDSGITAGDKYRVVEQGIPFDSEIRVTKKDGDSIYRFYVVVRSGGELKRTGVVKTFEVKAFEREMPINSVKDKPIEFPGGTLQAELFIGPSNKNP